MPPRSWGWVFMPCSTAARNPPASSRATRTAEFHSHKGIGLVSDVYDDAILAGLTGEMAIGHNRYSTTGSLTLENTQPLRVVYRGGPLALAHNGNLVNARELRIGLEGSGSIFQTTLDTEIFLHLMAIAASESPEEALLEAARQVRGAYSLVVMTRDVVLAMRDPHGFRPLCIGRLGDGYVVASESCALDLVAAEFIREVAPGELVRIDHQGCAPPGPARRPIRPSTASSSTSISRDPTASCSARPVDAVRRRIGHRLAQEHPADADVVISVPDSSNSIALGYSEESGIRFELGLIRNHYVGRTFIQPHQGERDFQRAHQVQPGARGAGRPAHRAGRRLDRARHHHAEAGAHAAPQQGGRGPRPRRLAAGHVPVLLRHRYSQPPRADRLAQDGGGDPRLPRRHLARLSVATRD
jgi:amidophosphoribosyltransferase